MGNPKTTIAGLVTAIITLAFWFISWQFGVVIPPEVPTFIITFGIGIIALFADPGSFKSIAPNVLVLLNGALTILAYLLKTFWDIVLPDFIVTALQAVMIYLLGWIIKDVSPGPAQQ